MKKCYKCKRELPLDLYAKRAASKDGKQLWCKECMNRRNMEKVAERKLNGPTIIRNHKHCTKCDTTKPIGQFYIRKSSADGHGSYCKPCWTKIVTANIRRLKGGI